MSNSCAFVAVLACLCASMTLVGCGVKNPFKTKSDFKFVSQSFECKEGTIAMSAGGEPAPEESETAIAMHVNMEDLKFLFSAKFSADVWQALMKWSAHVEKHVLFDITTKQILFYEKFTPKWFDFDISFAEESLCEKLDLDIEQSTFERCLAPKEEDIHINSQSMVEVVKSPEQERTSLKWQVDEKFLIQKLTVDWWQKRTAEPNTRPLHTEMTFEAKGVAGAPPDEVFQIPKAWEACGKDRVRYIPKVNATKHFGVVPSAIWECIGLPKPNYETSFGGPTQFMAQHQGAVAVAKAKPLAAMPAKVVV